MNEPRDRELRELIALSAVGALDADERMALEAEIAARPDLRAELAELQAVAASLAEATTQAPPPRLRSDVLDAVVGVPQLPPLGADALPPPAITAAPTPLAARRRRWAPLAAAAAVLALVAGGLVARTLTTGDDIDLAAVVADGDAVTYQLEGTISSLQLVHSRALDAMALVGVEVPMPTGDQVYELWMVTDGTPHRVEVFRPGADGSVELVMVDMDMPTDAAFAVTVEPPGGTEAPTGEVVAATG